ncbi:hypothetical protein [Burkholderia sp. Ac-20379]|uniref:hypothetical protein n=1 Tax=Burkholderia sp. Ac-20379 TaxID=2703900 RepID=UPI0019824B12|nr:hypothetical protein [Burkholderia sp. Ac-20379]MBN3723838.1 hypothetical protein [Burkholderia sp. Ac-20379]
MQTNRASDYVAKPGRIYVLATADMGWAPEFTQGFRQEFQKVARECGSVAGFGDVSGLELNQNSPLEKATAFHPDTLLSISQGGGVVTMGTDNRLSIDYDATLTDWELKRPVWRGKFRFARGSVAISLEERGAVFAVDLTNGLKRDGLLQGCSEIRLQHGNRIADNGARSGSPARQPTLPEASDSPPPNQRRGAVSMNSLEGLLPKDDHAQ